MSFLRKGARSVVVTYEIAFRVQAGAKNAYMDATLEESPVDANTANFTLKHIDAGPPIFPRSVSALFVVGPQTQPDRHWMATFLSAKSLFDLNLDASDVGAKLQVPGDADDLSAVRLPFESAVPMGGELDVVGLVGQRMVLRGKMFFYVLQAKRECTVEAQFDPYSGRPVRFELKSLPTTKGIDSTFSLTLKAVGTG